MNKYEKKEDNMIKNDVAGISFRVSWKQYLGGIRLLDVESVTAQAMFPFYAGFVYVNS